MDFLNAFGAGLCTAFAIDAAAERRWNYCAFCVSAVAINVLAYFT